MRIISIFCTVFLLCVYSSFADDGYAGWERLATRLKNDGISEELIKNVYNGTVVPPFDFVPFRLHPKETTQMYDGFQSPKIVALAKLCRDGNKETLTKAQKLFGVDPSIIVALLVVETHCGKTTGKELIVNRLSRISNLGGEENLQRNLVEQQLLDPTATLDQVRERATYLETNFYPQLRTLFELHQKGAIDLFSLRGSVAGAFGWPQFLPGTYAKFGTDGDRDGRISLFNPADAIFSVAHYLAALGWNTSISYDEKRKIIWNYNKSDPYIDTVLQLSKGL